MLGCDLSFIGKFSFITEKKCEIVHLGEGRTTGRIKFHDSRHPTILQCKAFIVIQMQSNLSTATPLVPLQHAAITKLLL
jgi:hypothetical protein